MKMDSRTTETGTAVVPVLRYRNLPAAIDWLCAAFAFEKHHVTVANDGEILFAQLTLGGAMIMVSPVGASAFDRLLKQPDEVGAETQVCYFFVADAHTHSARAKAAGAEIIFDIEAAGNGGRSYSCRDPEGHLWNFGTYNPWQRQCKRQRRIPGNPVINSVLVVGLLVGAAVMVIPSGHPAMPGERVPAELAAADGDEQATFDRLANEQSAKAAQRQLADLLLERDTLEKANSEIQQRLMQVLSEKEAAEQTSRNVQARLVRAWISKTAAERAARQARRLLERARSVSENSAKK